MKIYGRNITEDDMCDIAEYMDDDIRELLHFELAPCSPEEFLKAYIDEDESIIEILKNEFEFEEDE